MLTTENNENVFRALVAFPAEPMDDKDGATQKQSKEVWDAVQRKALDKCMNHFLSTKSVKMYPMPAVNPDKAYRALCEEKGIDISPKYALDEMNKFYKDDHLIFTTQKAKGFTKTDTREPSPLLKAYAYSTANPDGWCSDYLYPIFHSFGGVNVNASKLCHNGYGTMHDMLAIGDVDWQACFLPNAIFMAWDETPEQKPESKRTKKPTREFDFFERELTDNIFSDKDWAKYISDMLTEKIGRDGVVAVIECKR